MPATTRVMMTVMNATMTVETGALSMYSSRSLFLKIPKEPKETHSGSPRGHPEVITNC